MFDEFLHLNIETCSDTELKAWFRQAIPVIIYFVQASQKLLSKDSKLNTKQCDGCEKWNNCNTLCDDVMALLPGEFAGSANLNNTFGNLIEKISEDAEPQHQDSSYLKNIDRSRSEEIFISYKNNIHLFSKIEWRVITLRVQEGLAYKKIGKILNVKPSTASDAFQRSKRRMEEHYKKSHGLNRDT